MKILFKYTTRSRRSNFLRGIDSIVNNVADKSNYHILISVESELNDPVMHPLPQLECPHTYCVNTGKPTTKVDAINRDLNEFLKVCDAQIIVNMSDDMIFTVKGFDDIIRDQFMLHEDARGEGFYPDLDLCIHFPDGVTNEKLISMSILGRVYYERFNYIYHPSYKSLWCDNETMDVAKMLGCYKYVNKDIFKHLHPAFSKESGQNAPNDAQYEITESYHPIDNANYLKRKSNNFGLLTK